MSGEIDEKVALLIEETGCDREEALSALELCGWRVEEAVQAIARLRRNVLVIKAKFAHPEGDRFGLILAAANTRAGSLMRARAVLSYNPSVYTVSLEKDWFEFEKSLYGCRLWEGSLPAESLEIEKRVGARLRELEPERLEALSRSGPEEAARLLASVLRELFGAPAARLKAVRELLDLAQFRSLQKDPVRSGRPGRAESRPAEDQLVLKLALEEDPAGLAASDLRAGDMVSARIVDSRDIGQYLARLFGGYSESGPVALMAPVEAIESMDDSVLVRVRFSEGVCGDAVTPRQARVKAVRILLRHQESHSWWRRLFRR